MYKTSIRAVLLATLLILAVGFNRAQDDAPLESYLPANSDVYFSLRVDDGYIETLDGVYADVLNALSGTTVGAMVPPELSQMSVDTILNQFSMQFLGADFQTSVRSWLGQRVVMGMSDIAVMMDDDSNNDIQFKIVVAADITDSAKVRTAIDTILAMMELEEAYQESSEGGFTVLSAGNIPFAPTIMWNDSVLIVGINAGVADVTSSNSLLNNPDFNDTMSQLPAENYNIQAYLNANTFFQATLPQTPMPDEATAGLVNALFSAIGQQAIGFTLIDGRSFVVDVVQKAGDTSGLEEMGLPLQTLGSLTGAYQPIQPDFADNLPPETAFLIHGSNLRGVYDNLIASGQVLESMDPTGATGAVDAAIAQFETEFKAETGLSLQDDVLTWLEGDYAAFAWASVGPNTPSMFTEYYHALEGIEIPFGAEVGIVVETTNPAGSRAVFDVLAESLPDLVVVEDDMESANFERTTMGSADALILTVRDEVDHDYDALVDAGTFTPSVRVIELAVATDDRLVVFGTKGAVEGVFAGGDSLASAPHYQANSAYFLESPSGIYYISQSGVNTLFDFVAIGGQQVGEVFEAILESFDDEATPVPDLANLEDRLNDDRARRQQQAADLRMNYQLAAEAAALFDGLSLTVSVPNDVAALVRGVISLAPQN